MPEAVLASLVKGAHRGHLGGPVGKSLTLDFTPGHDLTVHESELRIRFCTDSAGPAWDPLWPSLSGPPLLTFSLSQNTK